MNLQETADMLGITVEQLEQQSQKNIQENDAYFKKIDEDYKNLSADEKAKIMQEIEADTEAKIQAIKNK
jgi:Zn-finger domain-containing protein